MPDVATDLQAAADQHSQAQTQPGPVDYGPKFLDLPQDKIDLLQGLVTKLNVRDQWARQIEILRCTLKRYFALGLQHVWWNQDASCFQVGQQGGSVVAENLNDEDGTAMQDFDIYTPNMKIFISVFAQNPATVRMEPDQPKESGSIRAAREAEKYIRVYDKYNPAKDAQIEIGRLFWNDGRVIAITEASEDGEKEITEYAGVLESKVPIYETDFALWPYCKVSKDHDICTLKYRHSEVADKIVAGTKGTAPNDEIARMARISTAERITQLSHDSIAYLGTEDRWWLRPSAFYEMADEERAFFIGGEVNTNGVKTQEPGIFPQGCKLTFVGGTFCGAAAVSMDDALAVCHAMPGSGQARTSIGDGMVPCQMEFNDGMNLAAESLKFGVPSLWADIDETEFAAIKEQLAQYGQIRPKKRPTGEPLENSFFPEPTSEPPAFLAEWLENLQGNLAQLFSGNQPALFGGNMEDQKTARGYQMARDQSLGLLALVWVPYQTFAAKIHEQAAKIASNRDKPFAALVDGKNGKQETLQIDPGIMQGGFTCSAITDQSFPESWSTKSQTWKSLLEAAPANPLLAQNLQLPDNLVGLRDAIGLSEFVIEGADSRDKQLEEWALMQKGEGVEQDQEATAQRDQSRQQQATQLAETVAPGHGQVIPPPPELPPIMKSSIPIDPETDDHVAEGMECFRILNSPEGLKIKATPDMGDGRNGMLIWQDLKAHFMAHVAAGQAKGLMFPPPVGGPPPMLGLPPKPGLPPGGPPPTGGVPAGPPVPNAPLPPGGANVPIAA